MSMITVYLLASALLVCCSATHYDFGDDLITKHSSEVSQRLKEVMQFFLPLPDDVYLDTARRYIPVQGVSEDCRNHSQYLLDSLQRGDIWALEMLDAASKPGSGLLDGHLQDLGNYRQCIRLEDPTQQFKGQHCFVATDGFVPKEIADRVHSLVPLILPLDVVFSVCVPSSCTENDVAVNVNHSLIEINATATWVSCSSGDPLPFKTKDYFALLLFASITCMVVLGSVYESNPVLAAFSLRSNLKNLMDTKKSDVEISCLNGLRVIFILIVIVNHRLGVFLRLPTMSIRVLYEVMGSYIPRVGQLNYFVVDGFFMMSGTVLSYNFFRKEQQKSQFSIIGFYVGRYFRLTPLLVLTVLYYATLLAHQSQGPLWSRLIPPMEETCCQYWWAPFLQVINFYGKRCVLQSWFVSCDFQFCLIAPIFLLTLQSRPKTGLVLMAAVSSLSVGAAFVNAYIHHRGVGYYIDIFTGDKNTMLRQVNAYQGPHFRLATFCIGVALGYLLFNVKYGKMFFKPKKHLWLLGWMMSLTTLVGIVVYTLIITDPQYIYNPWVNSFHIGCSGSLFCISVGWIIFACFLGHGGLVNSFLSSPRFRPFGKLTFSVFLVHMIIIYHQTLSMQQSLLLNFIDFWFWYAGDVIYSFALALLTHLAVEVPCIRLVAHLLSGNKRSGSSVATLTNQSIEVTSGQ